MGDLSKELAGAFVHCVLWAAPYCRISSTSWHLPGSFLFFMNLAASFPASVVAWSEPELDKELAERTNGPVPSRSP